jgi:glutathione S-transferase
MKMKLYTSAASPFARKVRMVIHELGLTDLVEEVPTDAFKASEDFLAANPLSKLPTLVTDRGESLPDSSLIVEYLLTRGRGLVALPRGKARWAALRQAQLADGIMVAATAAIFEKRRPPEFVFQGFIDRQIAAINRSLDAIEAEAGELHAEEAVSIVEITVAAALGYLDLRHPQLAWRDGRQRLAAWYAQFAQRPSMLATAPA